MSLTTVSSDAACARNELNDCSAAFSDRTVDSTAVFMWYMFLVGRVITTRFVAKRMYEIVKMVTKTRRHTGPNHESFIGYTDDYREYLREYGPPPD